MDRSLCDHAGRMCVLFVSCNINDLCCDLSVLIIASKLQEQLLSSRVLPNNFQLQKKKTALHNREPVYTLAVTIHLQ